MHINFQNTALIASLWSLSYCLRRWFAILFSPNTNYVDIYYQKRANEKNGYFCLERSDSWIMVFRSWTLRYATFSPMILQLPPVWKPHIPMKKKPHTHQNLEQVSSQIKKFFVMKWAKNQMVYSWNRVVYKIKKLANNPNDRPIIKWKRLPLPTKISGGPQKNPFNGKKRKCAWKWQNSINLFFIWPPFFFFYE